MVDLRKEPHDEALGRVERALNTRFDRATEVRKRRSVGFRTDRDTWVRIEAQPVEKLGQRGWNGVEMTAVLRGVAIPEWRESVSWVDTVNALMWRADETDFIAAQPVKAGGTLTVEPELSDSWWEMFNSSLDALGKHHVSQTATQTTTLITQARLTDTISRMFPHVDTTIDEWAAAHGDLAWANLTAPECWILDWEDWGMAPRGLDAATLWRASLAVPSLADRVREERRADLDSRTGKLSTLFLCVHTIEAGPDYAGPHFQPAKAIAANLYDELRS